MFNFKKRFAIALLIAFSVVSNAFAGVNCRVVGYNNGIEFSQCEINGKDFIIAKNINTNGSISITQVK